MSSPAPPPPASQVGRNALVIGLAGLFVRGSGLIREIVFAGVFGATVATDAYNAAFRAAQFFRELLAEGSLANTYVPTFARVSEKEGLESAWRLANAFLGLLLVVLGVVTVATFAFAEGWVWLIASGFAADADKFALSARLTRILSPFLACVSLASLFMGMLNIRGRFFLPALAPAMFNLVLIAGCLLAAPFERWTGQPGIVAAGIASLVGGAGQFLVQIPALYREGFRIRPHLRWHPALGGLLKFAIPALIGIMTVQFNLLVESQLASRFGDGPVSYLNYAFRIVQLPNTVVAASVGTAALAGLATLAAAGRKGELSKALSEALTLNSFLVLPSAVGLYLLAEPITRLMYERGAFTAQDTASTALVLKMYAIATWGICTHRVALPSFYALGRPYFPTSVAIGTMLAKLPVALFLVYSLDLGFVGLPLSHAVLVTVEVALLFWGFTRPGIGLSPRFWGDHLRIAAASAVMGLVTWALRPWAHGLAILPVVAVAGCTYFAAAHLVGLEGSGKILARLRRPRGLPPSVDPQTQAALGALASRPIQDILLRDGGLTVRMGQGQAVFSALDGTLRGALEPGQGPGEGPTRPVRAILRIGPGGPTLQGLRLGDQAWHAEGDRVVEGPAPGPEILVPPGAPTAE